MLERVNQTWFSKSNSICSKNFNSFPQKSLLKSNKLILRKRHQPFEIFLNKIIFRPKNRQVSQGIINKFDYLRYFKKTSYVYPPLNMVLLKVLNDVKKTVLEIRRETAKDLHMSYGSTQHNLLTVLGMNGDNARLVPKDLIILQKWRQVEVSKEKRENVAEDHTFIERIITGDETCAYEYGFQTSQKFSVWFYKNGPKPKRTKFAENTDDHPSRGVDMLVLAQEPILNTTIKICIKIYESLWNFYPVRFDQM